MENNIPAQQAMEVETKHEPSTTQALRHKMDEETLFKKPLPIYLHRKYVATIRRRRRKRAQARREKPKVKELPYCLQSLLDISEMAKNAPFNLEPMKGGVVCTLFHYRLSVPNVFNEHFQNYVDYAQQELDRRVLENGGNPVEMEEDPVLDFEGLGLFGADEDDDDEVEMSEEEEEDVDSDGPCDEEVQGVVDGILVKMGVPQGAAVNIDLPKNQQVAEQTPQPSFAQPRSFFHEALQKALDHLAKTHPAIAREVRETGHTSADLSKILPQRPFVPPAQQQIANPPPMNVPRPGTITIENMYEIYQLWLKCQRRPNVLPPHVRQISVTDPEAPENLINIARGVIEKMGFSPGKDFETAFNENFFFVTFYSHKPPSEERFFCRCNSRNFLVDPPIYEEVLDDARFESNKEEITKCLLRKDKWDHPQVEYAEVKFLDDSYWYHRAIPMPVGLKVPPRASDYDEIMKNVPSTAQVICGLIVRQEPGLWELLADFNHAMTIHQEKQNRVTNEANRP